MPWIDKHYGDDFSAVRTIHLAPRDNQGFLMFFALTLSKRSIAAACVTASAVALMASLCLPLIASSVPSGAIRILTVAAGGIAILGGVLSLLDVLPASGWSHPAPAAGDASASATARSLIQDMSGLLAEERGKLARLQGVSDASRRDAQTAGTHVENLAGTALDAESRLTASVARATEQMHGMVPEVLQVVRQGIVDAVASRLAEETESPTQWLQAAARDAVNQITALQETTTAIRRDVLALGNAGREIAMAGATAVSRLSTAAGQIEAAVTTMPEAAGRVVEAAKQAIRMQDDANRALRVEAATLAKRRDEAFQAADELRASGQDIENATATFVSHVVDAVAHIDAVLAEIPAAVTTVTTASDAVTTVLTDAAGAMHGNGVAAVTAAAERLETLADTWPDAVARLEAAAPQLDEVVTRLADAPSPHDMLATLTRLSAELEESVQRIESALAADGKHQPGATAAVGHSDPAMPPGPGAEPNGRSGLPHYELETSFAAATAARPGIDEHSPSTHRLTEALTEAIFGANDPVAAALPANRILELLEGIEAATQRLRSVAGAVPGAGNDQLAAATQGNE